MIATVVGAVVFSIISAVFSVTNSLQMCMHGPVSCEEMARPLFACRTARVRVMIRPIRPCACSDPMSTPACSRLRPEDRRARCNGLAVAVDASNIRLPRKAYRPSPPAERVDRPPPGRRPGSTPQTTQPDWVEAFEYVPAKAREATTETVAVNIAGMHRGGPDDHGPQ